MPLQIRREKNVNGIGTVVVVGVRGGEGGGGGGEAIQPNQNTQEILSRHSLQLL